MPLQAVTCRGLQARTLAPLLCLRGRQVKLSPWRSFPRCELTPCSKP